MIEELSILQKDLNLIQSELEINKPYEACGVIIGITSDITVDVKRVIPVTNVRRTTVSFELDPKEFYNAWNNADKSGNEIVGIYHTHPSSYATPSSWDRETMRNVPSVWLIAGVNGILGYIYDETIKNVRISVKEIIK